MIRSSRKAILLSLCLLALAWTGAAQAQSARRRLAPNPERFAVDYLEMEGPSWKRDFPNLGRYEILAAGTPKGKKKKPYNCIAYTLRIYNRWVWPGESVSDFDRLYGSHGYKRVRKLDFRFNPNVEKVVLYATRSENGKFKCTHGCRQLSDGSWTSKLGHGPLIRHKTPGAVSGPSYGKPIAVYVRPRQAVASMPRDSSDTWRASDAHSGTGGAPHNNARLIKANVPAARGD